MQALVHCLGHVCLNSPSSRQRSCRASLQPPPHPLDRRHKLQMTAASCAPPPWSVAGTPRCSVTVSSSRSTLDAPLNLHHEFCQADRPPLCMAAPPMTDKGGELHGERPYVPTNLPTASTRLNMQTHIWQCCPLKAFADAPAKAAGVLNGLEKLTVLLHALDAKCVVHTAHLQGSVSMLVLQQDSSHDISKQHPSCQPPNTAWSIITGITTGNKPPA